MEIVHADEEQILAFLKSTAIKCSGCAFVISSERVINSLSASLVTAKKIAHATGQTKFSLEGAAKGFVIGSLIEHAMVNPGHRIEFCVTPTRGG